MKAIRNVRYCVLTIIAALLMAFVFPCRAGAAYPALTLTSAISEDETGVELRVFASGGAVSAVSGEIRFNGRSLNYISCTSEYDDWAVSCSMKENGRLGFLAAKQSPASGYEADVAVITVRFEALPDCGEKTTLEVVNARASDGVSDFLLADARTECLLVRISGIGSENGVQDPPHRGAGAWVWITASALLLSAGVICVFALRSRGKKAR